MKKMAVILMAIFALITFLASFCGAEDINACVQKKNGQLRIVAKPTDCNPSETWISWNKQGPTGEQKPGYVVQETFTALASDSFTRGIAYCNEGDYVTGCGGQVSAAYSAFSAYSFRVIAPYGHVDDPYGSGWPLYTGCRVELDKPAIDGCPQDNCDSRFVIYVYCGRTN